jgi:hypothetical protein
MRPILGSLEKLTEVKILRAGSVFIVAKDEGTRLFRSTRRDVVRFPTTGLRRADVICLIISLWLRDVRARQL